MKLSAREDIEAPVEAVFAAVTDIAAIERQALRRGFDVTRLDGAGPVGEGSRWSVAFDYRGRRRTTTTEITRWEPGHLVLFQTRGEGVQGVGEIDLTRLARSRTRLHIAIDIRPETFRARLVLQTIKLARSELARRLKDKLAALARRIEAGPDEPGAPGNRSGQW